MSVLIDYASSKEKRKGARKSQKYKGKNAFPRNKQRNSLRQLSGVTNSQAGEETILRRG